MDNINKSDLTIIIVAFNSSLVIKQCLKNIDTQKYQIVVVDNASTDNTLEIISQNFPDIKIIKNDKNLGYGRANNIALKRTKTPFALILNPDAFILEEDIERVLEIMKKDKQIALAAPFLLKSYPVSNQEFQQKLDKINQDFLKRKSKFINKINGNFNCNFLSGAVLFLKVKIFNQIGFFDENFFLFYEDNEICQRSIKNGYKNLLVVGAKAFHNMGNSSQNIQKIDNNYKIGWHLKGWSKFYFMQKNQGLALSKTLAFLSIFQYLFKVIFFRATFKKKRANLYLGGIAGILHFLIGKKAFNKNGNPRG